MNEDSVRRLAEIRDGLKRGDNCFPLAEVAFLVESIDSLTAERDLYDRQADQWHAAAAAAEAEVKGLREALELIAGGESLDAAGCARVARAALATPPSEGQSS